MNTLKNSTLALLCLALAATGVIAWQQHCELRSVRAASDTTQNEKSRLSQRVIAAEQRASALEKDLAAARSMAPRAEEKDVAAKHEEAMGPARLRSMMANAAEMMNRPEVQKAMALRQKAELDSSYAAMFRQLKLSPQKLEQLKKLMVERQQVGADVFSAAAQQGMDPLQNRRELAKLTAEGQAKVDAEIRGLLGETDYPKYQTYQATLPQRNLVNQLQQSLSYTDAPLTESQSEQLVQILADNQPPRPPGAPRENVAVTRTVIASPMGGSPQIASYVGPAATAPITDAAVAASNAVLSAPQVEALRQVQQQQAQLRAMAPGGSAGPTVIQVRTLSGDTPPPPATPLPTP